MGLNLNRSTKGWPPLSSPIYLNPEVNIKDFILFSHLTSVSFYILKDLLTFELLVLFMTNVFSPSVVHNFNILMLAKTWEIFLGKFLLET